MKAAVVSEFKKALEIKEVDKPKLEEGEVLVKIDASGVCHTDLHAAHGDWPVKPKLPLILGHEGVRIVVEAAKGVKSIKVGDRVGIPWLYSACGECEYCLTGQKTLCPHQLNGGYSVDERYAEYCKAPADYVAKINLDPIEVAPILCDGVTTYKALKVSGARPGNGWLFMARELFNVVKRAATLADGETCIITPKYLPEKLNTSSAFQLNGF